MILEVKKDAGTELADLADSLRPGAGEEVDIDFEHSNQVSELSGQIERFIQAPKIERYDELAARCRRG